ncbi:peptidoglycan DD-metalloendopeptidase family protein [Ferrimonas aestuarii]|nr:peptidoglycan DD-metalloendopeptidase family protein [Ferrimonas aestuarii]
MRQQLRAIKLDNNKPLLIGLGAGVVLAAMLWSGAQQPYSKIRLPQLTSSEWQAPESTADVEIPATLIYEIAEGDSLSGIFSYLDISQAQMYQVLEADYAVLALDTLRPGNRLGFWLDEADNKLMALELAFNPAHKVRFTRVEDGFEVEEIRLEGQWRAESITGEVHGSFSKVASEVGLSANDVATIANLFKDKFNFRRDLRAGDKFGVVRQSQFVEDEFTGNREVLAVSFSRGDKHVEAFRHTDGQFYDGEGGSLQNAFLSRPFNGNYRISDNFNPRRLHPVTGRVKPHNGTDWALPSGTPLLAAGDGVVTRVENHPYAGRYVVIDHGSRYRTRYLHMSKVQVRKGQRVTRGQRIGLSGATGRVTGAHLHYEFHINGRPVNALTAKIPKATAVDKSERQQFYASVHDYRKLMGVEGE